MDIDIVETDDIALNGLLKMWDRGIRDEARVINGEIMSIIDSLGSKANKYRRERENAISVKCIRHPELPQLPSYALAL